MAETLIYYAEQKFFGRKLPQSYEDVEDDPHQMGGDFLLEFKSNSELHIVFSHPSQTPPDRPSPNKLIEFLQGKNNSSA